MAGSILDLGNGKYKLTVSNGFNPDGTRNRSCKTITANGKTDEAKQDYVKKQLTLFEDEVKKGDHLSLCQVNVGKFFIHLVVCIFEPRLSIPVFPKKVKMLRILHVKPLLKVCIIP